jgi:hypothetical protein
MSEACKVILGVINYGTDALMPIGDNAPWYRRWQLGVYFAYLVLLLTVTIGCKLSWAMLELLLWHNASQVVTFPAKSNSGKLKLKTT